MGSLQLMQMPPQEARPSEQGKGVIEQARFPVMEVKVFSRFEELQMSVSYDIYAFP